MGPSIIFDKSTLQSLNIDEAVWLDQFYLTNITPVFFVETLADLEKEIRSGRKPEEIVGSLAIKTPDFSSKPNADYKHLLEGELWGLGTLDLENGRPHISGGKKVELGNKTGVVFQQSPEEEALSRWHKHEFLDIERMYAKAWRNDLSNINLEKQYQIFQAFFPLGKPKDLPTVKKFVDFYINTPDQEKVLMFGLTMIGVSDSGRNEILERWRNLGKPNIKDFAPYFHYIFSLDLFFYIAISADLIGRGRPSHKIDLSYLYYLPFCNIFTSNDKLHKIITPFFLRENQTFLSGEEFKNDLSKLNSHFDSLPDEIKERGVVTFATIPPDDDSFLTTKMWDKYMSKDWRKLPHMSPQPKSNVGEKIYAEIRDMVKKAETTESVTDMDRDESDSMVIQRSVMAQKGKWKRFPPEVINRRKNENGEWADVN